MAKKVRKLFGTNPEKVVIVAEAVEFDEEGFAEVSDELAEVVERIPGYQVIEEEAKKPAPKTAPKVEDTSEADNEDEDNTDEEAEKVVAPKKPAPRKPAPKKA